MNEAQAKVRHVLRIWITVMNNVRMRDRSVKILQYGSQMLIGYWGAALSKHATETLRLLQRTSSTSRKAFWILKSINNMGIAMKHFEEGYFSSESTLVQKLDAIENIFLIWYYWCETKTYFARTRMFGLQEEAIDYYTNLSWALGDVAFLLAAAIRLRDHTLRCYSINCELERASNLAGAGGARTEICDAAGPNPVVSSLQERLRSELQSLQASTWRFKTNFVIGVLELVVSLEYAGVFHFLTGKRLHTKYIGAAGVCSSSLIIYNGIVDAIAEHVPAVVVCAAPPLAIDGTGEQEADEKGPS
jgi:hypothetical protein